MSRISVAQLQVQQQGAGLARTNPHAVVRKGGDIRDWADNSSISAGAMISVGLGLALVGGIAATFVMGFAGTVVAGSMITVGGGLAFLGVLKRKGRGPEEMRALPPSSSEAVIAERSRRVYAHLERSGTATFEGLAAALRWTESALLETLVAMKDSGHLVEDLNLETGEWFYRLQTTDYGTGAPMTLADRQALRAHTETD